MSKKNAEAVIVVGASPRANLLPPEVRAGERAEANRRRLIAGVVVVVVIVIAGFAGSTVIAALAGARLTAAQERTTETLAEQAKYVEVRQLATQVSVAKFAQTVGVALEIDWKDYLDKVQASLPAGTTIDIVNAAIDTAVVGAEAQTAPLQKPRVAELTFSATTPTLPDVSQWVDSLSLLPGFADAVPSTITANEDGTYLVNIIMHINEAALTHRFATEEATE